MRSVLRMSSIAFAALLLGLLVFASQNVQAATLTVSNTADNGAGSLRQAIIDATTNAAANTVNFNIPLTDPGYDAATDRFTITLANQLPDIPLAPLTIDNATGRGLTVQGNNTFRIFTLVNSAVVSFSNLTIRDGSSNGGLGGGIYMGDSAVVFLTNCIVTNNTASNGGGGIWMNDSGTLHILDSTISNNTTSSGNGGGLYISLSGTLNITNSTVSANNAPVGDGGGIYNGVSGTVNATNITVNGNTAGNLGGGIHNVATATISSSTISSNTATNGGGGMYNNFTATLNNSLVALNTGADGPDLLGRGSRGKPFTGNSNLIGNADGSEAFGPTTNLLGTTGNPINPRLGPLQDNGGATFTRALLVCSPAIDAGTTALATDQRDAARPQDGDGVGGAQSDIGAFEVQTALVCGVPELSISDVTQAEGNAGMSTFTFTVSLTSPAGAGGVTFNASTADGTTNPAQAGSDYVGFSNQPGAISQGNMSATVSVTVNGDFIPEQDETFFVNLSNVTGANLTDGQGTGTILNDDNAPTAGQIIISEFRLRGPVPPGVATPGNEQGELDEFIELYNTTDTPMVIGGSDGGWALVANIAGNPTSIVTIPDGTSIPAHGHYLISNSSGYSLDGSAPPDQTYTQDIPDDTGIALFATATTTMFDSATPLDAAGFGVPAPPYSEGTPLPAIGANVGEYSFVRNMAITGLPKDTGDNAADFKFVATDGGQYNGVQASLGAPGPENTLSPIQRNAQMKASAIDPQCSGGSNDPNTSCARARDTTPVTNGTLGTLSFRRRFTNKTGLPVTQLRFRLVDITTAPAAAGTADLRVLSSATVTLTRVDGTPVVVRGTMLEATPAQALGGGLNSALVVTIPGGVLAPNAPIDVQLVAGVEQGGAFRFLVNVEALNGAGGFNKGGTTRLPKPTVKTIDR